MTETVLSFGENKDITFPNSTEFSREVGIRVLAMWNTTLPQLTSSTMSQILMWASLVAHKPQIWLCMWISHHPGERCCLESAVAESTEVGASEEEFLG